LSSRLSLQYVFIYNVRYSALFVGRADDIGGLFCPAVCVGNRHAQPGKYDPPEERRARAMAISLLPKILAKTN
jgi:hypothetical protein